MLGGKILKPLLPDHQTINVDVNRQLLCMQKYVQFGAHGGVVVKAQRYKPAGSGFDSQWCHWNFSVT
jgi:hypothetical protein